RHWRADARPSRRAPAAPWTRIRSAGLCSVVMVPAWLPAAPWEALLCVVMLLVLAMCGRNANALRLNRADDSAVPPGCSSDLGRECKRNGRQRKDEAATASNRRNT